MRVLVGTSPRRKNPVRRSWRLHRHRATALAIGVSLCGLPAETGGQAGTERSILLSEPFKVFDNLYYVGTDRVSAFLMPTEDGLILIDALPGENVAAMIEGIRGLGFDPADIRYVFVSHAHFDHIGGARTIQRRYGTKIGLSAADWAITQLAKQEGPAFVPPERDLVIEDGQEIRLGGQAIRFLVTPGHTPGTISLQFDVRDGSDTFTALMFGGVGLNFEGVERTQAYIRSVERLLALGGMEVNIPNHPTMGGFDSRVARLGERGPGDPHPLVAPAELRAWLERLLSRAQRKLERERGR